MFSYYKILNWKTGTNFLTEPQPLPPNKSVIHELVFLTHVWGSSVLTPGEVFIIREPTRHRSAASGRLPWEANIRGQNVRGNGFPRRDWIDEKTDRRAGAICRNLPSVKRLSASRVRVKRLRFPPSRRLRGDSSSELSHPLPWTDCIRPHADRQIDSAHSYTLSGSIKPLVISCVPIKKRRRSRCRF